jgi:hypothetical protein
VVCTCCGFWRIDAVELDGVPRLRLKRRDYLVGYFTAVESVAAALAERNGPSLAEFHAEAAVTP